MSCEQEGINGEREGGLDVPAGSQPPAPESVTPSQTNAAEDAFVNDVNALYAPIPGVRLAIGRRTNEYIAAQGGTQYGFGTLKHLAKREDLKPSLRSIYRYWHYYRIKSEFGDAIAAVAPALTDSHYYELSRLLGIRVTGPTANEEDETIKRRIINVASQVAARRMSAEDLASFITDLALDLAKQNVVAPEQQAESDSEESSAASDDPPKPRRSKISRLLSYDADGLQVAADFLGAFTMTEHLKQQAESAPSMARSFNVIGTAVVALARFLADAGHCDNIAPTIHRIVAELDGIDEQPEPDNENQ